MTVRNEKGTPRGIGQPRLHVAGLPVVDANVEVALDSLWNDALSGSARVYALVNAYSASLRRRFSDYAAMLEDRSVVPLADGASLVLGARLTAQGDIGRCPGPDLLEAAAARAAADGTSFYLLGGGEGVAERLGSALRQRHPGLMVAGVSTPPYGVWGESYSLRAVADIQDSGAGIVWLGVSAPKQEIWALRYCQAIGRPIVCVGAAFDFVSGDKPRAPEWMRATGVEWFFRLLSEPRRLGTRYIVGNVVFLIDLVRHGSRFSSTSDSAGL